MTEFKCVVGADLFRRAAYAVSTEYTRYYLGGVFVEAAPEGGAILTSTNGHWLVSIHDPRGVVEGSGIVSLSKPMMAALKPNRSDAMGAYGVFGERALVVGGLGLNARAYVALSGRKHTPKGAEIELEPRNTAAEILEAPNRSILSAQFRDVLIDGAFPDWRRIVPSKLGEPVRYTGVNAEYLAKAAEALSEDKSRAVTVTPSEDESSPMLVTPIRQPYEWKGFAIVMPVRSAGAKAVPDFAKRPA